MLFLLLPLMMVPMMTTISKPSKTMPQTSYWSSSCTVDLFIEPHVHVSVCMCSSWCEKNVYGKVNADPRWSRNRMKNVMSFHQVLFHRFSLFISFSQFQSNFWRYMLSTCCSISLNYLFRIKKNGIYYDFDLVMLRVLTEINYHSNWWSHYNF